MKGSKTYTHYTQSLATRLSLWITLPGAAIFIAVLSTNYFLSRNLLEEYVEQLAKKTASSTVQKVDTVLETISSNADALAASVSAPDITRKHIRQMIKAFVKNNNEIFGMTVALEPGILLKSHGDFAPYYYKKGNTIAYTNLAKNSYRYKNWHWYRETRKANAATWSEPYIDKGGGDVHMVTYSTPIYFNNGKTFAGVATADIKLSWLDEIIQHSKIGKSGFGFIVSKNDVIIAYPDQSMHMKNLRKTNITTGNWKKYFDSKISSSAVYFSTACHYRSGNCWIAIKTLPSSGWKIIIVFPEQELIANINSLTLKISIIAVTGLIILFFVVFSITRTLIKPLGRLVIATKDIGEGRLDNKLPEPVRNDEIGSLTSDFGTMRTALKKYIKDLKESTARTQKMESEIQIAKDIQMSMIPGGGNVSINENNFQLFAYLRPAYSVGGDLYYYQRKNDELYFILGDVSDKGVPAALFMAKTVTLYTRALSEELSPGRTLSMMNEILVQNNDTCMFVTALCGKINLSSGKTIMSNAGHMNPVYKDNEWTKELDITGATALGLVNDIEYPDIHFEMNHETALILYTDGISEAHNSSDNQYTEQRLIDLLKIQNMENIDDIGKTIIRSVDHFAEGIEQFDDITLLIFYYK